MLLSQAIIQLQEILNKNGDIQLKLPCIDGYGQGYNGEPKFSLEEDSVLTIEEDYPPEEEEDTQENLIKIVRS